MRERREEGKRGEGKREERKRDERGGIGKVHRDRTDVYSRSKGCDSNRSVIICSSADAINAP